MRLHIPRGGLLIPRSIRFILAILVLASVTLASPLCDCFDYPSHRAAFGKAKAVFVGRVIKIDKKSDRPERLESEVNYSVTFRIDQRWKGAGSATLTVWLLFEHDLCSKWKFLEGEKYLVYAQSFRGSLIVSGYCSRTRPFDTKDADALREFKELDRLVHRQTA